ncbi:protein dpy-30 homolog isoform X2 [Saimiri boliviensis]|uniref:protein dpy-30 homolog isoform X2 n=1 Tax=Saimiri boliviensis TaxID=27679 RepID=UPI003D76D89A
MRTAETPGTNSVRVCTPPSLLSARRFCAGAAVVRQPSFTAGAVRAGSWWRGAGLLRTNGLGEDWYPGTVTCRVRHGARADAGGTDAGCRKSSL